MRYSRSSFDSGGSAYGVLARVQHTERESLVGDSCLIRSPSSSGFVVALPMHVQPSSLRRTSASDLGARVTARLASARVVPRRQQPNDPHGDEERAFRAAFECHSAVVRAILGELSPGRCDGAPRGLEASSRDRDCTRTCGTFALGLGTGPEDARGPVWHEPKIGESCRRGWSHFGVTQSHDTASFCLGAAPATVLQPCATDQKPKRTSSAAADSKAAASNFAWPCAGR